MTSSKRIHREHCIRTLSARQLSKIGFTLHLKVSARSTLHHR